MNLVRIAAKYAVASIFEQLEGNNIRVLTWGAPWYPSDAAVFFDRDTCNDAVVHNCDHENVAHIPLGLIVDSSAPTHMLQYRNQPSKRFEPYWVQNLMVTHNFLCEPPPGYRLANCNEGWCVLAMFPRFQTLGVREGDTNYLFYIKGKEGIGKYQNPAAEFRHRLWVPTQFQYPGGAMTCK